MSSESLLLGNNTQPGISEQRRAADFNKMINGQDPASLAAIAIEEQGTAINYPLDRDWAFNLSLSGSDLNRNNLVRSVLPR
jgi:hypothetical protein